MTAQAPENLLRRLEEQKQLVLSLAALQTELRTAVTNALQDRGDTMGAVAAGNLAVNWRVMAQFLAGSAAVCSGATLGALCVYLGRNDLRDAIQAASRGLSERMRGVAAHSPTVVDRVFRLHAAHESINSTRQRSAYARRFGAHTALVRGVLALTRDALIRISDDTAWHEIEGILEGRVEATPAPPSESAVQALLDRFGGETSPLGVKYVLGPKSFRDAEVVPDDHMIEAVRARIEEARGLLNVLAQVKDETVRARVRARLSREVEELQLALYTFSFEHPNALTPLHQAQRITWAARSRRETDRATSKRRKGR